LSWSHKGPFLSSLFTFPALRLPPPLLLLVMSFLPERPLCVFSKPPFFLSLFPPQCFFFLSFAFFAHTNGRILNCLPDLCFLLFLQFVHLTGTCSCGIPVLFAGCPSCSRTVFCTLACPQVISDPWAWHFFVSIGLPFFTGEPTFPFLSSSFYAFFPAVMWLKLPPPSSFSTCLGQLSTLLFFIFQFTCFLYHFFNPVPTSFFSARSPFTLALQGSVSVLIYDKVSCFLSVHLASPHIVIFSPLNLNPVSPPRPT